jgi:thioredoxin 1
MGTKTFEVTETDWESEVLNSNTPVLVDFWAEWCAPCKMLDPVLDDIATEYDGKLRVVKIDADANPDIAMRYGVMGLPTMILFKDGEEKDRLSSFKPKDKIMGKFGEYL